MHLIEARNVDHGLEEVLSELADYSNVVESQSRNGPVRRLTGPVVIQWSNPLQRVSFSEVRDSNPFFHLYEALWMLGGYNDVKSPSHFAANLANYSDDGVTLAGAYGYRWRNHFGTDQIDDYIIPALKKNKEDRRCVLAMWDGVTDVENAKNNGKDTCCNLDAVFDASTGVLDLTVFNRSNDLVWGATGANVVHFSMLQEYVASCIGVPVGKYWQISSNSHLYKENDVSKRVVDDHEKSWKREFSYLGEHVAMFEGSTTKEDFDADIRHLVENYGSTDFTFKTNFFQSVVEPMMSAYNSYKQDKLEEAVCLLRGYEDPSDWEIAGRMWLERRITARNKKAIKANGELSEDIEEWAKTVKAVWPSATFVENEHISFIAQPYAGHDPVTVAEYGDGSGTIVLRGVI